MAIESGLAIGCSDLQSAGGIKNVLIREWNSPSGADTVTFDHTSGNFKCTVIKNSADTATQAVWGVYESQIERSSLTVTGTNENKNFTTYECVLSLFLPKIDATKLLRLQELTGKCLMVLVVDSNTTLPLSGAAPTADESQALLIGASSKFSNLDDKARSQTWARIASIEGGTGAAFSDEDGVTLNITCTQYELPNPYIPAGTGVTDGIRIGATGLTATTT